MVSEVLPAGEVNSVALIGAGLEPNLPTNHAMLAIAEKTRDFEDYVDKCNKLDRVVTAIRNNNMKDFQDLMYELNGRMTQGDKDKLLAVACRHSREDIARVLLAVGADVNCVDGGETPLMTAAHFGKETIAKLLIEKGADVNLVPPGRVSPLTEAASSGKEAMVKLLLEKGADVNWENEYGRSALSYCWNSPHMRSLLLEAGMSKDLALLCAIRHTSCHSFAGAEHQVILELVRSGANVNIVGKDGKTPLMLAREKKLKEVEQLLIVAGAKR